MIFDGQQQQHSNGKLGSAANPLRVAVFGAGPAGFYAVEELLKQEGRAITVDLFDRLPTPYGLVRGGVAPDHQKIKAVIKQSRGYKGHRLPGVPFDDRNGIIPNRDGRVLDPSTNTLLPRVYVAGWIKRGPSGVIGTNKPDSITTVQAMLEDADLYPVFDGLSPDLDAVPALLAQKQVRAVTFAAWKRIDQIEIAAGKKRGKPREKLTTSAELLAAAN